ncbi:AIPR family protein [Peribacillus sp. SCS-26]|uniref:AIPR family protein n=1 Tax=Paraperibacillus marinus TaxID=3115295 RepID=UPI003906A28F
MIENRQRSEFLKEFMEDIEDKAARTGSYQVPFLEKMITFMDRQDEPEILLPPYTDTGRNIAVNAYSYDEDSSILDIFVSDYSFDQNEDDLLTINMTEAAEIGSKAKRFITNAKTLVSSIDESLQSYDLAKLIADQFASLEEVNIYVITNRFYLTNKPVNITIPGIDTVNVQVWDIDRVQQLLTIEQGMQNDYIDFEKELGETFEMMLVPDPIQGGTKQFDCYVGYISAELLAKAYDIWGPKLVERNVRSFLQARGATNKGIRNTLKDPLQRKMFVAYNNGISTVAKSGEFEAVNGSGVFKFKGLGGWQIVNGGQTTASIHQAYKDGIDLKDVYVQAKLTLLKSSDIGSDHHYLEDQMVSRISEYANTQNKINKSDLLANSRFMADLEKFSRNIWIPALDGRKPENKWYFERARGQYMVDTNRRKRGKEQSDFKKLYPKDKVLTKVEVAKYFMSWEGYPHVSSKGGEEAFTKFMDANKEFWKSDNQQTKMTLSVYQKLIARTIINKRVTEIVDEMKLKGYKANVIYYTTAMLHHLHAGQIDLVEVWEHQGLSDKWDEVIRIIADKTLFYLKESAGDRNVTQWAKQEACWVQFKEMWTKELRVTAN